MFGPLEFNRRDLMAINIQRGRDHGVPDYNTVRMYYGLPRKPNFDSIVDPDATADPDQTRLVSNLRTVVHFHKHISSKSRSLLTLEVGFHFVKTLKLSDCVLRIGDGKEIQSCTVLVIYFASELH